MKNFIKLYKIKLSGKAVLKADTDERPVIRRGCEVSAGSEVLQADWDREAKVLSQAVPSVEGAACVEWNKLGKRWESRQVSEEGNRECRDCLARRMIPGFIGREMRKNGKFLGRAVMWSGLHFLSSPVTAGWERGDRATKPLVEPSVRRPLWPSADREGRLEEERKVRSRYICW